jgi:hypothetical protein
MEAKLSDLLNKVNSLSEIAASAGESESSEVVELLHSSRDICEEMKRLNLKENFISDRVESSEQQRRSRRTSTAVINFDALRRSSAFVLQEPTTLSQAVELSVPTTTEGTFDAAAPTSASPIVAGESKIAPPVDVNKDETIAATVVASSPRIAEPGVNSTELADRNQPPLFEHFLMIGCLEQDAKDFSMQMQLQQDLSADTITDRIKRTMNGIFASQRQQSLSSSGIYNSNSASISVATAPGNASSTPGATNTGGNIIASSNANVEANASGNFFHKFRSNSTNKADAEPVPSPSVPSPPHAQQQQHLQQQQQASPVVRSANKPLDVPTSSSSYQMPRSVQSWMGINMNMNLSSAIIGMNRRPPSVASPEPVVIPPTVATLQEELASEKIQLDHVENLDPRDEKDGIKVVIEEYSTLAASSSDDNFIPKASGSPRVSNTTEDEDTIYLSETAGRSSLAGLSSLTESVLKSTTSTAGSTLSKIGGSIFTKMNSSVPFSLSPQRSTTAASTISTNSHIMEEEDNDTGKLAISRVPPGGSVPAEVVVSADALSVAPPVPVAEPTNNRPIGKDSQGILFADVKSGRAVLQPAVIFQFPDDAKPVSKSVRQVNEVISGFCLPAGAALQSVPDQSEEILLRDILYPRASQRHTQRSLVFWFEDKNNCGEVNGEKMYGVCLITPRVLVIDSSTTSNNSPVVTGNFSSNAAALSGAGNVGGRHVFVVHSCYAFVTRYPFFDFFFRVLQDILAVEKLFRMEQQLNSFNNSSDSRARTANSYVPEDVLRGVLKRLASINVPSLTQTLSFFAHDDLPQIEYTRKRPRYGWSEHDAQLAEWAIPGLLMTLPVEMILWAVSFLFCEAKFLICGKEAGLVSIVANGLQFLLRPLEWAGPFIPIVPAKMVEFVESPVPILAGFQTSDSFLQIAEIQSRCHESEHLLTVLLDIDRQEILVPASYSERVPNYCMPSMESLVEKLHKILQVMGSQQHDREIAYIVADRVATHIEALCVMAKSVAEKQKQKRDELHKMKLQIRQQEKPIQETWSQVSEKIQVNEDSDSNEDDDCEDDDESSRAEQLRVYYKQLAEMTYNDSDNSSWRNYVTHQNSGMDLRALFSAAVMTPMDRKGYHAELWQPINHLDFTSDQEEFMEHFVSTQMYNSFVSVLPSFAD